MSEACSALLLSLKKWRNITETATVCEVAGISIADKNKIVTKGSWSNTCLSFDIRFHSVLLGLLGLRQISYLHPYKVFEARVAATFLGANFPCLPPLGVLVNIPSDEQLTIPIAKLYDARSLICLLFFYIQGIIFIPIRACFDIYSKLVQSIYYYIYTINRNDLNV